MIKTVLKVDLDYNPSTGCITKVECTELPVFSKGQGYADPHIKKLNKLAKTDSAFKPGTKIYFLKGCTVPRNKMKDFNEDNKIKVVRDITKADVVVFSKASIEKNINYSWFNKIEKAHYFRYLDYALQNDKISKENYDKIVDALSKVEYDSKILTDYGSVSFFRDNAKSLTGNDFGYNSSRVDYIENSEIKDVLANPTAYNIVHQDVILSKINTNNTIDEEVYKSISSMLKSKDSANHCIAMEIMANSDYNKSAFYLMLLFKDFTRLLYDSRYKNHVNFKSLTNYFGLRLGDHMDWDSIIFTLKSRKLFTKEAYDYIKKQYMNEVYEYFNSNRRFGNIKIDLKAITFNVEMDKTEEVCLDPVM